MKAKKVLSCAAVIAVCFSMLGGFAAFAEEAPKAQYKIIYDDVFLLEEDFENMQETEGFVSASSGDFASPISTSFINSNTFLKVGKDEVLDSGKSLFIKDFADMRWWSLSLVPDDCLALSFNAKISKIGDYFSLCVTEAELVEETSNESEGGVVVRIVNSDTAGEFSLLNRDGKKAAVLKADTEYTVTVLFQLDSDEYYIFLNDEYLENGTAAFAGEVTRLTAFRFDMRGGEDTGEVVLDDVCVDTCSLKKISGEEPTEAPTEEPTTAPTEAPANKTDAAPTDADKDGSAAATEKVDDGQKEKSGCGSIIGGGFAAATIMLGAAVLLKKRK